MDCFMHNFRLRVYLVFGLIFSASVQGQSVVTPIAVNSASINSSGQVVAMHTYRAQYAGQPDSYYSRAVAYNKATTGKLGKARAFVKGNALNLGIVAATLAVGYALDEITKDIYSTPPQYNYCGGSSGDCVNYYGGLFGRSFNTCSTTSTPQTECFKTVGQAASTAQSRYNAYITAVGGDAFITCQAIGLGSNGIKCTDVVGSVTYAHANLNSRPTEVQLQGSPAVTATDTQIHDAMFPQPQWQNNGYLGDNLPELLRDPATGAVELTQEVQDVATQIQNQHNLQYNPSATPVTAPTVSPDYATTTNNQASSGMPAFCGWASVVCDFVNWFKTDTTTEPTATAIPQENLTYETPEWSSGLGSGSCPSPNTISVLGGSFEISYQPFCTLAEMIKYLVLALAYITSAMIISGVRK